MRTTISKLFQVLKQKVCKHEFDLKDLKLTGIPEIEKPSSNDYEEWVEYYHNYYESDAVTKRVRWPCCKCSKVFYAHCGLEIYNYGKPKRVV